MAPPPSTPCDHCGLPVGPAPVRGPGADVPADVPADARVYCCTGCAVVAEALRTAGLGDTYYRLRSVSAPREAVRPSAEPPSALMLSEIDGASFLDEHTTDEGDGVHRVELFVDGVHCAACVWLVERLPFEIDGVVEARLDLPRARLRLRWRPDAAPLSEVVAWLARFGYTTHPARRHAAETRSTAERRLLVRVGVAWALAGNVMLLAFAFYAGLDFTTDPALAEAARWASLALALPAVAYGAAPFFRRAWASVRLCLATRRPTGLHMDVPIALGLLVGTADSAWAVVSGHGEVWFDSVTVLIAALLTARWLQLRSRRLAGDASERLLALVPSVARRLTAGRPETVAIDALMPGDIVLVEPGEVVPVDGSVVDGTSDLDNAVLTGESRPDPARPGTNVAAGATNLTSPLQVRVTARGDDTRVGRLLAWVRDASSHRAPVVLLADRVGGYFVFGVLALAALTAGVWAVAEPSEAARHVVALLVVTCPCALGMATPLALAVASGRAARAGIFVKTDEAAQQLARIDCVVLDKTGTLTEGRMRVVDRAGDEQAIALAAVLEAHSNHPVARAVAAARTTRPGADSAGTHVAAVPGEGMRGTVEGRDVSVGRPAWIRTHAALHPADAARLDDYARRGHTPVAVAVDGRVAAVLAVGDRIREDAPALVARMHAEGRAVHLLSGDHPAVVAAVASGLGIPAERAHGGVSPEAKRRAVERLRAEGRTVMMVGDGVNDAAALQSADVGVAVHGGSTASLVAADVFLTRTGLRPVSDLLDGAGRMMRVVRRNLAFSLVYNVLGAGAAMAGLVDPLVAAVAMPASSLIVVGSSILQRPFGEGAEASPPPAVVPPSLRPVRRGAVAPRPAA